MAHTQVAITLPKRKVNEKTSFSATSYYRNGDAAGSSTTAEYRVDCLTSGQELTDWTSLTPAASIAIAITPTENRIVDTWNLSERKQLTVSADRGLSTEGRESVTWKVKNILGST